MNQKSAKIHYVQTNYKNTLVLRICVKYENMINRKDYRKIGSQHKVMKPIPLISNDLSATHI